MAFDEKEKELLNLLVKKELEQFEKEGKTPIRDGVFLEAEHRYDDFLKEVLKKLG
jgi:hypothetical protein